MKLTTITMATVDGVTQGLGGADEGRRGGFERGGWVAPMWDIEGGPPVARSMQPQPWTSRASHHAARHQTQRRTS
jgi:hypothetical protein